MIRQFTVHTFHLKIDKNTRKSGSDIFRVFSSIFKFVKKEKKKEKTMSDSCADYGFDDFSYTRHECDWGGIDKADWRNRYGGLEESIRRTGEI